MKSFKKFAAMIFAAAIVVAAVSFGAYADSTSSHTITINNIAGDNETHTYNVYQVFAGDYDEASSTLSNVTWGSGVDGNAILDDANLASSLGLDTASEDYTAPASAADVAAALAEVSDATDFSKVVAEHLTDTVAASGSSPLTVTGDGYYFAEDVTENLTEATKTNYIMQVVGTVVVTAKSDVPTVVKKVEDKNDSTGKDYESVTVDGAASTWQDSADYDIGDTIPFQITGTLPDNYDSYDSYQYTFSDTMSAGLTYTAGSARIYLDDGTDITNLFTETVGEAAEDGSVTVTWSTENLKASQLISADSKIIVSYSCTLNESAVLGSEGNLNVVKLAYSNNPNNGGEGTSETPEDKNIVFTYGNTTNKVDEDGEPLKGAGFTLYKLVDDPAADGAKTGAAIKEELKSSNESINADALDDDSYYVTVGMETVAGDDTTTFEWKGIDDGIYVLVETTIPSGYNAWASEQVTITASHDAEAETPTLTELKSDNETFVATASDGSIEETIVNQQGSTLPSTGGMGTTLFYVIGGILVLAAAIVLISRKRVQQ